MYKSSKYPLIKIGGYILMGFFVLVIIFTFGVPEMAKRNTTDPNVSATVNGDQITRIEFVRAVDSQLGDKRGEDTPETANIRVRVLNDLIYTKLQYQYSLKMGVRISDDIVADLIRKRYTVDGQFNDIVMKRDLEQQRMSLNGFYSYIREYLIISEMHRLFNYGTGVSPEERAFENGVKNSSFQAQYAFLSNDDFKKKAGATITASDAEIDAEMAKNKKEIKDPATDRPRFKAMVLDRKLEESKKTFVSSIDEAAAKGEKFAKTAALLGGTVSLSEPFKAGEPLKEQGKNGKVLYALADSELFKNGFVTLDTGVSSRAVITRDGIYLFTPVKKNIKIELPSAKDAESIDSSILSVKQQGIQTAIFMPFIEEAKVVRNIKDEASE
jgi:hypothetical protein